jgi:O-antigen/teichoic acid export membrane protein
MLNSPDQLGLHLTLLYGASYGSFPLLTFIIGVGLFCLSFAEDVQAIMNAIGNGHNVAKVI